jgi:beta-galactosidase
MLRVEDDGYYSVYSAAPGWMNSWRQINARKNWLAGGFLWTGYDYIGEPVSPVSVSSSFGAIDLCGFEKDSFYYFQANWSSTPAVHLVPSHWNFQVDQKVEVWAYTAHCASLELKLNGKSHSRYHAGRNFNPGDIAKFGNVTWENGTLEAICRDEHKVTVASDKIQTAGAPAGIRLDVDYNNDGLRGDGTDVFLARVTVVDANGVMVPEGPVPHGPRQHVNFEVTGGSVYGVCNGDPTTKRKAWFESDKSSSRTTFNGLARVIVLANKLKSPADDAVVKLTATTDSSTGGGNFHAELTVKVHE